MVLLEYVPHEAASRQSRLWWLSWQGVLTSACWIANICITTLWFAHTFNTIAYLQRRIVEDPIMFVVPRLYLGLVVGCLPFEALQGVVLLTCWILFALRRLVSVATMDIPW